MLLHWVLWLGNRHHIFIRSLRRGTASRRIRTDKFLELLDLVERGGLNKVGADQRLINELPYQTPQHWSAALRSHPKETSGIRYRRRHDGNVIAFAFFDTPPSTFQMTKRGSLLDPANRPVIDKILTTFEAAVIDPV